jgi:hypothetical protein
MVGKKAHKIAIFWGLYLLALANGAIFMKPQSPQKLRVLEVEALIIDVPDYLKVG